jgi:urocanate hydratase
MITKTNYKLFKNQICQGIPTELPPTRPLDPQVPHAPKRNIIGVLSLNEQQLAVRNALRYFPTEHHAILAPEFASELKQLGRIYMHRFRPTYEMYARPIDAYPHQSQRRQLC